MEIKKLEISKLIKELDFIKSDYEYKSEIIKEADSEFLKNVDRILNINQELKLIYDEKICKNFKNEDNKVDISLSEKNIDKEDFIKSDKIKKLYREIVKITHPDRIDNKSFNNLYIESSKYYNSNDIIGIYKICEYLGIEYEMDISEIDILKESIKILKDRICFIENTHTWIWYNNQKDNLILNYIRNQILMS